MSHGYAGYLSFTTVAARIPSWKLNSVINLLVCFCFYYAVPNVGQSHGFFCHVLLNFLFVGCLFGRASFLYKNSLLNMNYRTKYFVVVL